MLTERQAWLELANHFDGPRLGGPEYLTGCDWLCVGIGWMNNRRIISGFTSHAMVRKIENHAPSRGESALCWPGRDRKSRAAFCRKMAALCKPAKKPAKKRLVKAAK